MDNKEILSHIDHTLLKAFATWDQIKTLCDEAITNHTASVCVPPCYVKRIHDIYPELTVCTVVGFPLGYETTEGKIADTKACLEGGAKEIDMVVNICDVKNGDWDKVEAEIKEIRNVTAGNVLKVIIETCYLTEEEKIRLCEIVTDQKADYIKTSFY